MFTAGIKSPLRSKNTCLPQRPPGRRCFFLPDIHVPWGKTPPSRPWGYSRQASQPPERGSLQGGSFRDQHPPSGGWALGFHGAFSGEGPRVAGAAVITQMAKNTYPLLNPRRGRSLQGVLEPSLFSSRLHVPVCVLSAGQLSLGECVLLFLPDVGLLDTVVLARSKAESTRSSQKHLETRRGSLLLSEDEAASCWKMGHRFSSASCRVQVRTRLPSAAEATRAWWHRARSAVWPGRRSPSEPLPFPQLAGHLDVCRQGARCLSICGPGGLAFHRRSDALAFLLIVLIFAL